MSTIAAVIAIILLVLLLGLILGFTWTCLVIGLKMLAIFAIVGLIGYLIYKIMS